MSESGYYGVGANDDGIYPEYGAGGNKMCRTMRDAFGNNAALECGDGCPESHALMSLVWWEVVFFCFIGVLVYLLISLFQA